MSKPLAERYLGQEQPEESSQITIPKDEPGDKHYSAGGDYAAVQPAVQGDGADFADRQI